uniref:SWIM-type domain-containing protein n=1 Tax=Cucumis melo TaxID=3656 RepID=A0A9I9E5S4_CUCME
MDENQQFIVKLNVGCCSCRVWNVEEIPCAHALDILRMLNLDTYSYVSKFYYRETLSATYNGCIQPVRSHFDLRVVDYVMTILPPVFKRQAGRPRKQRIPSIGEFNSSTRCSNYNHKGHNSRTCKQGLNN